MKNLIFTKDKIHLFKEIDSTNLYASKIINDNTVEGTIIWALFQTQGKGQKDNLWESKDSNNLTFSVILKPKLIKPTNQFNLNMAVSLSMVDFLKSVIPISTIKLKWPNDIYINKDKVAGILIESQIMGNCIENSIIGIGLNVNQIVFSNNIPNPTSLKLISSIDYNLEELLYRFLPFIEQRIQQLYNLEFNILKDDYLNNLLYFNERKEYCIKNQITNAIIVGISEFGKLKLKLESNSYIECDLKEIKFML